MLIVLFCHIWLICWAIIRLPTGSVFPHYFIKVGVIPLLCYRPSEKDDGSLNYPFLLSFTRTFEIQWVFHPPRWDLEFIHLHLTSSFYTYKLYSYDYCTRTFDMYLKTNLLSYLMNSLFSNDAQFLGKDLSWCIYWISPNSLSIDGLNT